MVAKSIVFNIKLIVFHPKMHIERGYDTNISAFWFCENFKLGKMFFFHNFPRFFFFKEFIFKSKLIDHYVRKNFSRYLEKRSSFLFRISSRLLFTLCQTISLVFYPQLFSDLGRARSVLEQFSRHLRNLIPKHVAYSPSRKFAFGPFYHKTTDDQDHPCPDTWSPAEAQERI